jgi:hypothetical protein
MPLSRVYHLTRERSVREPRIEQLAGREAVAELVQAAYRLDVTDTAMLVRQFRLLSRLAQQSRVRTLALPSDFCALPAVHRMVLDDLDADDSAARMLRPNHGS